MKLAPTTFNRLVEILASTDALFSPVRWNMHANAPAVAAAVAERPGDYSRRGVPYAVVGDVAARAAGERELQNMEAAGLLRLHRHAKRTGVSLTDRGDDIARALTAGYTCREAFPLLKRIRMVARKIGDTNAGCTIEYAILGKRDYNHVTGPDLNGLEMQALPLLRRGWLGSACDMEGRVGYAVTDSGLAARRPRAAALPEYDHAAGALYDELFAAALAGRDSWKAALPSLVAVPLGCGSWPGTGADQTTTAGASVAR